MAQQLSFPSNYELNAILQDLLPELVLDDPLIGPDGLFPIDTTPYAKIMWEQLDNFFGLTLLRGLEGQPGRVQMVGLSTYEMDPGYYGDVANISEEMMTKWRAPGNPTNPWDLTDLMMVRQQQLLNNAINRIRQVLWVLASTGTFSVASPDGITHTGSFSIQTYSTTHDWADSANSTPLADFRNVKAQHRGHSVRFDASATAYMNLHTFNFLDANANTADLYGRRTAGLETVEGLNATNHVLTKDDLPNIVVMDEGYLTAANPSNASTPSFTPFLADNLVVVTGKRPGNARLGRALFTRNASILDDGRGMDRGELLDSPYAGFVMKIVDKGEVMAVGREIDLGLGFNWGPTIEYPSSVVAMNVGAGT